MMPGPVFADSDYVPLAESPLAWRWTDADQHALSASALATIRPLTRGKAAEIHDLSLARRSQQSSNRQPRQVQTDGDRSVVRTWLEDLAVGPSEPVILSWDATTAVVTIWRTFLDHWDAFCYPASDDVAIWAPACDWSLCYYHYEVLELSLGDAAA